MYRFITKFDIKTCSSIMKRSLSNDIFSSAQEIRGIVNNNEFKVKRHYPAISSRIIFKGRFISNKSGTIIEGAFEYDPIPIIIIYMIWLLMITAHLIKDLSVFGFNGLSQDGKLFFHINDYVTATILAPCCAFIDNLISDSIKKSLLDIIQKMLNADLI